MQLKAGRKHSSSLESQLRNVVLECRRRTLGGRLTAGQGTLDPCVEVRILTPEPAGPLAQGQSDRLITGWSQVRSLQGPSVQKDSVLSLGSARKRRSAD